MVPRLRNMVKLECKSPVPSDIDIAQAATPVHISDIAKAAGLTPDEYDLYGTTKAKVGCGCLSSTALVGQAELLSAFGPHRTRNLSSLQVKLDVMKKHASSHDGNYGNPGTLH